MIDNGAEIDKTNNKNETPYDLASVKNNFFLFNNFVQPEIKKIFTLESRLLSKNFAKSYANK